MFNTKIFFDLIRPMFDNSLSQGQVDGMNSLLAIWSKFYFDLDLRLCAYCFATSKWETGSRMQPVREAHGSNDNQSIARLDNAFAKGQMPWVKTVYWRKDNNGRAWFGRGHVQLTHESNYTKAGQKLGVPLDTDTELALDAEVSARILFSGCIEGWFTSHKLTDFVNDDETDFFNCRKVVNPGDSEKSYTDIANDAEEMLSALSRAEEGFEDDKPPVSEPAPPEANTTITMTDLNTLLADMGIENVTVDKPKAD